MRGAVPTYDLYGESHPKRPDFWLHWETIASRSQLHNWEIKTHRHTAFFQILYFRGGTGDAVFDGQSHPIQPPVMITVPPRCEHGFRFSRDMDGMVITMLASRFGSSGRSLFEAGSQPTLISLAPDNMDTGFLTQSLERLSVELISGGVFHDDLVESYLKSIVLLAARLTAPELPLSGEAGTQERLKFLHIMVNRHFREHHPAEFYANRLNLSATHLNRIVKAATGQSTNGLLAGRLVDQAKRDLVFTSASVKQIAYDLGFTDPAYFTRFFTKETGTTPRQYRTEQSARMAV
ncbi:helix-turn-helix domain-containing protein [Phyllobacterium myrsinacearum]|uniref:AraC family transcriptional activator of pobA n=1 Tax=Phyllobacterium myrsinacearum TaxID=28101 RepID=A0A839EMW6_9HYPH|nr:helix-turn-helix domain-containing protein [Phyllobacterium myrsinacearum]MBA8881933.1 AraC family transcriptional activator of pobA [Phyllobacterium myrsinacearum]